MLYTARKVIFSSFRIWKPIFYSSNRCQVFEFSFTSTFRVLNSFLSFFCKNRRFQSNFQPLFSHFLLGWCVSSLTIAIERVLQLTNEVFPLHSFDGSLLTLWWDRLDLTGDYDVTKHQKFSQFLSNWLKSDFKFGFSGLFLYQAEVFREIGGILMLK